MPYPLKNIGITNPGTVYFNASPEMLYEHAIANGEGIIVNRGPLRTETGKYTGRSPNDRYVVEEASTKDVIAWGKVNVPIKEEVFDKLLARQLEYLQGKNLYVQDCHGGRDEAYRLPVRVVSEFAWSSLFAYNMFARIENREELEGFKPGFTVLHTPNVKADPSIHGTNSEAFVIINFAKKMVIIGGTRYAGEIKKSIFSVLNYMLPGQGVLPMHCSANIGDDGKTALFFGLSGTGKTTLSADKSRGLIGDDEHGWSEDGVFNFEQGCYAKVIRLSPEAEPDIFLCTRLFGTILENVVYDETDRTIDLDDGSLTENTRASYPIEEIPNFVPSGTGGHPNNVIFLTADAFGVLPPISKLSREQAMYHFISGYTAKLAGTERGVTDPKATFSACFGEPFLPLPPARYAEMLGEKIEQHDATVWLVNTGWTGGPYGEGHRMEIKYTRAMLHAALEGKLDEVDFVEEPFFGLMIPARCPDVPADVLNPRKTWKDKDAYDELARKLVEKFRDNFERYADTVTKEILAAGPKG